MITKARISKFILTPSQDAENYFNLKANMLKNILVLSQNVQARFGVKFIALGFNTRPSRIGF